MTFRAGEAGRNVAQSFQAYYHRRLPGYVFPREHPLGDSGGEAVYRPISKTPSVSIRSFPAAMRACASPCCTPSAAICAGNRTATRSASASWAGR